MTEAYDRAALRHWSDGDLLEREGRLSNSDQLYAFAAECAIKTAWAQVPGLARSPQVHVHELWDRARLQSLTRCFPALAAVLGATNPFQDWSVNQRYSGDEVSPAALAPHRDAARRLLGAVGLHGTRTKGGSGS